MKQTITISNHSLFIQIQIKEIQVPFNMTEKQMINENQQKANTRRSRKEQEGRDFLCGCGKKYLSYNALYTHVKTKHDGVQPEGTFKAPNTTTSPIPKKSKQEKQKQALRQIQLQTNKDDYPILNHLDVDNLGIVPPKERITKLTASTQIYDCFTNLLKGQELKLTNTSPLDIALTIYIFNAGQYVTAKIYSFYLLFAKTARNCYQDHGVDIYKSFFSNKEQAGSYYIPNFSALEVKYFPIVVDFLLMGYIPENQNFQTHEDMALSMLQLIIQDFCNWIFRKKLTNMKIKMIGDYQLTDKTSSQKVKKEEEQMDMQKLYHFTALQNKRQKYRPRDVSINQVDEEDESEDEQLETTQKRTFEEYQNEDGDNSQQIQ